MANVQVVSSDYTKKYQQLIHPRLEMWVLQKKVEDISQIVSQVSKGLKVTLYHIDTKLLKWELTSKFTMLKNSHHPPPPPPTGSSQGVTRLRTLIKHECNAGRVPHYILRVKLFYFDND